MAKKKTVYVVVDPSTTYDGMDQELTLLGLFENRKGAESARCELQPAGGAGLEIMEIPLNKGHYNGYHPTDDGEGCAGLTPPHHFKRLKTS